MSHRQTIPSKPKLGPLLGRERHPLAHLGQEFDTDFWYWVCEDCGARSLAQYNHPAQGTREYIAHVRAKHPGIL